MKLITLETYAEWIEWRFTGIGASDAPSVMDTSPFMTKEELWAKKTGRMLSQPSNYQMRRGKDLEALARKEYEKMTGISMPKAFGQSEEHPFALVSLDGVNFQALKALEIKCPGKKDHAIALRKEIPDKYVYQCVHICMVTKLPYCDYFSFDGTTGVIVPFKRNIKLENELLRSERELWKCVLTDRAPSKKINPITRNIIELRRVK